MVIERTVLRSLLPNAIAGDPCIAKLSSPGYDVAVLYEGAFHAGNAPQGSQAESVTNGFFPSRITETYWNL